ncbi:hypothetical protein [Ferruginibacter sp. HRS2-29]|uniref:hypothetical protein n=1 Tax=Ferruginibacter sp. HRS2-29 TaxID=2487334 RepID=UPI0020CBB0D9|nr:hypothetical protein [Ferruginibacter sp. HRS2-29]MCP9751871.1 hypothetical protein [Ferruginibacter sp. HRS2-29]
MNQGTKNISSITEAYQAIHDFYDCFHLHEALEETGKLFKWAGKEHYYNETTPANIIFLSQQLFKLFSAAEFICYSTGRRSSAILHENKLVKYQALNMPDSMATQEWASLTRHLSWEEYVNPYSTFEKFGIMENWEEVLQELMEFALMNGSIEGCFTSAEMKKWRNRMMGVVEGGWFVEVRGRA